MRLINPIKVVCVDASWSKYPTAYALPNGPLNEGDTYTAIGLFEHVNWNNVHSYKLAEKTVIDLSSNEETGFLCSRFVSADYHALEFVDERGWSIERTLTTPAL